MIITKEIEIKTTNKNIGYYKNIGFEIKSGDIITIIPEQLPLSSKIKINVECDNCHDKYKIIYFSYLRNIKNGDYYCKKCSHIKGEKTNMLKYGVKHPLQSKDIQEKSKKTNLQKYGFEYPGQNSEIKDKIKETCLSKYGETSFMKTKSFKELSEETLIRKYGVNHPLRSDDIKEKIKDTCIEKYGCEYPSQNNIIKEKIKVTKKEKYNDENYNNRKKYKETCLEIFGYENPMSNFDVQDKLKKSLMDKYGVEYPAQYEIFYEKMLKSGYKIKKYKDIYYQGEYEYDFLEKYYDLGISRGNSIKYEYNNSIHIYFPDFYYKPLNLIVEIKSSKWYEEHLSKNLSKRKACQQQGYNFIFIIDKKYEIFDKLISKIIYNKEHSWQYDIRLNDVVEQNNFLKISDFSFNYVPDSNKDECNKIKKFIEKYEWLGKMPNRPTHRFIAKYNNEIAGVVVFATPNSFSKLLGDNTDKLEKLISRGACASWTPKNLASSLIMWSIKWMTQNTQFRLFTAYSDPEAKELGTIYQACNFIYLGQKYGSETVYFDINKSHLGWFSNRNFHRRSMYKKTAKKLNIEITWNKVSEIPINIKNILNSKIDEYQQTCIKRYSKPKHKYAYILGKDNKETKYLKKLFEEKNPKLIGLKYPKNR